VAAGLPIHRIEQSKLMENKHRRKDPTRGVAIFFVVIVLLVLAAILYKGISGRREYEAEQAASDAAAAAAASQPSVGASAVKP
jgi:Tfp pilus assembly protein PilX